MEDILSEKILRRQYFFEIFQFFGFNITTLNYYEKQQGQLVKSSSEDKSFNWFA